MMFETVQYELQTENLFCPKAQNSVHENCRALEPENLPSPNTTSLTPVNGAVVIRPDELHSPTRIIQ